MAVLPPAADWTAAVIVMGVSGAGKSTIAEGLAKRLGRPLVEGDDLHPKSNVEKMSHGTPLTDADRLPWLQAIAQRIDEARKAQKPIVVTCSALKQSYREILAGHHKDVGFVYLQGDKALIADRLEKRTHHFMPPGLLDSQFATLQEPAPGEPIVVVSIDGTPEQIVEAIVEKFTP